MIELNKIYNEDCLVGMQRIPDESIDLVIADPPYEFKSTLGGGEFGTLRINDLSKGRLYHNEIKMMSNGVMNKTLEECIRVCKKPNMYIFCSKEQIPQLLSLAKKHKLNFDVLTWHKTNPVPACGNKYLSDTEYIIFMRAKGVKVYGSYDTKRKWYATPTNLADKKLYRHPTPKPVPIIQNFIVNSSLEGEVVLDPFMGSGTTAIACMNTKRNFVGFELNKIFYDISVQRITEHEKLCKSNNKEE